MNNKNQKLNNELSFLIACCQTDPSGKDIEFIQSTINAISIKSVSLLNLANQHGILPIVYKTLKNHYVDNQFHKELLNNLKPIYTQIAQQNIFMSAELLKLMKLLQEKNIEALSFKGPLLAQMAYGDIILRQFADLDILMHKKHREVTEALLLNQGYTPLYSLTSVQNKVWYAHAKDMSFIHPDKNIHIEIHWLLLDSDYPLSLDIQKFWEQSQTIDFKGNMLHTFDNNDLLIYLCIHGSKHLWERIEWIKDIDLIVRTQNINWDVVSRDLHSQHFERMVYLGLHLSRQLFSTPLPDFIFEKIEIQKEISVLEHFVYLNWQNPQGTLSNTVAMLKFFPTLSMKLQYLFKVIFKPSQNEYRFIDLPQNLYWAYYLIRPFLLLKKYLIKN